jgi:hypothetical protein
VKHRGAPYLRVKVPCSGDIAINDVVVDAKEDMLLVTILSSSCTPHGNVHRVQLPSRVVVDGAVTARLDRLQGEIVVRLPIAA